MAEEEGSGEDERGQREKILRVRWRGKRSLKPLWGRAVLSADLQEASTPPQKRYAFHARVYTNKALCTHASNSAGIVNSTDCVVCRPSLSLSLSLSFPFALSEPLGSLGSFFGSLVLISIVTYGANGSVRIPLRRRKQARKAKCTAASSLR